MRVKRVAGNKKRTQNSMKMTCMMDSVKSTRKTNTMNITRSRDDKPRMIGIAGDSSLPTSPAYTFFFEGMKKRVRNTRRQSRKMDSTAR